MSPAHEWIGFVKACRDKEVVVHAQARRDASAYFNLRTEEALLDFIANNGLENLTFINTRPFEKWKGPKPEPNVDAYRFTTGPARVGYIAILKSPVTEKWVLKSFHREMQEGAINSPFTNLRKLLEARLRKEEGDG